MSQSKDFWILVGLTIAIIATLILSIYTSPTYTQKTTYINSLILFIEVLFISSATILILWKGFKNFALMLTIILAAITSLFGIEAAIIASLFTYITWGFAFSIEVLLAHNEVQGAIDWFKKHYSSRMFSIEYKVFYPLIKIMHFLLETIPSKIYKEPILDFDPDELYTAMMNELNKQ